MDRFGLAKRISNHQIAFQMGSRIVISDFTGNVDSQLDVKKFNQEFFVGDFAFFSNGDILIALNQTKPTVSEQIAILKRETNESSNHTEKALYRCAYPLGDCKKFTTQLPNLSRSFRLFRDEDDAVYIADTSRHSLLKLDANGDILAKKDGFKFPNDIKLINAELYVADTNHHSLKHLSPKIPEFGSEISKINISLNSKQASQSESNKDGYVWPIAFELIADEWWVMVGNDDLAHARLAIYNRNGNFKRELTLPMDAGPVSMLTLDDSVLLFDLQNYRIYRFDFSGKQLEDFKLITLEEEINSLKKQSYQLNLLQSFCVVLFIAIFLAIFVFALVQHLRLNKITA